MSHFTINNRKYNYFVEFGNLNNHENWKSKSSIIEYCSHIGINIPHYCYHRDLSISGNCRICLIELKQASKPIVSCSIAAKSTLAGNAEIFTNSPIVKKARENILEFLLLNHPLDCPICDQGGECDLQDQSLFFGFTKKRFYNHKRVVVNKNIGPVIKTVMTRCIHCTRCVRFATEIAGIEDLGILGRSLNSEIGTYVEKAFNSEISGNIIDLCPVGALTSKFYSYSARAWELKGLKSIDFSDGFSANIILQVKNRKLVKIHSESHNNDTNWISDKTRFSFDGLSPSNFSNKTKEMNNIWLTLFHKLTKLFYFYDHLSKHNLKLNPLFILFGETLNNESLNLLIFIEKKYSFVKVRRGVLMNNLGADIENFFQFNNQTLPLNFKLSSFCFLIGVDTRNEGFYLNIKLRQRKLQGDFKVLNMFSSKNLTYTTKTIGTNPLIFKDICEGNNIFSQNFVTKTRPLLILNQKVRNRIDSNFFFSSVLLLQTYTKLKTNDWNGLNIMSNSLNSVGVTNLNSFKEFTNKDFINSSGLFLINYLTNKASNVNRLLQLKLLTYLKPKFNNFNTELSPFLEGFQKVPSYLYFPSTSFFEASGTFINTLGVQKVSTKILQTNSERKQDWEILRMLLSNCSNLNLLHCSEDKLSYSNWNLSRLRNYILFLKFGSMTITNLSFVLYKKNQTINVKLFKFQLLKTKMSNTKLKRYIYDFYLSTESFYSRLSIVMSECSGLNRIETNNFEPYQS